MSEILEIVMILCFGASWPFNVYKSYHARTAKGKIPLSLHHFWLCFQVDRSRSTEVDLLRPKIGAESLTPPK